MWCDVPCCNNNLKGKRIVKRHGITFYNVPKDPVIRKAWAKALGLTAWKPRNNNVICSEHFKEQDFYITKEGVWNIHSEALPIRTPDLEASAVLKVCRICLALDTRLHDIREFDQMFEQITGLTARDEESARLPQRVCWECAAQLTSAANFRAKALLSDGLLHELLKPDTCLKVRDIKTINRAHYGLKTNLIQKVFKSDHFDVRIEDIGLLDNDCVNAEDISETNKFEILQQDKIEQVTDLYQKEKWNVVPNNSETDNESDIFNDILVENDLSITNMDELSNNDTLSDEYRSDDEVMETEEEVFNKSGTENKEKENEELDVEKNFKDTIKFSGRTVFPNGDGNVKKPSRRSRNTPIDPSLFTIKPLTLEELLEEVRKRKESAAYEAAPYKCTVCFRGFRLKHQHATHILRHSEENGAFECVICKLRVKTTRNLRHHMKFQHKEQYSCKKCDLVTRHKGTAQAHEKFHAGYTYQCLHCSRVFTKQTTYLNHLRLKHMPDCVCEFCGYTFLSDKGVLAHKIKQHPHDYKTMPSEGPYCDVCEIIFASQDAYDVHYKLSPKHAQSETDTLRIRNEYRPMYAKYNYLLRRRQRRTDTAARPKKRQWRTHAQPVQCEQCGLTLRSLNAYTQHFRRDHPGIPRPERKKLYMCEECGKKFADNVSLESHKWVHTGQKRFQCDHCQKLFASKQVLSWHMRIHDSTKEKYQCRHCSKLLTTPANLKRHEFLHTGEKPFKCYACEKCFSTIDSLTMHRNHVHLKVPWPKRVRRRAKTNDHVED